MVKETRPYVVVLFTNIRMAFCLDRGYNLMYTGANVPTEWGKIKIGDIVQVDSGAGSFYPPHGGPAWADQYRKEGQPYVVLWTRYYD